MHTHNKKVLSETFKSWLPLAIASVIVIGFAYVAVQQNYRMSANDPQIQIAQDIADAVSKGSATPDAIVPANPTADLSSSLSAFVTIYNATSTPIGSSVSLDGKLPTLPAGVFDVAKLRGEDRFTWQPKPGLRFAAVLTRINGTEQGYVLAGRSLREIEIRITQMGIMAAAALAAALILSFLAILFFKRKDLEVHHPEHNPEHHHIAGV